jgi:hypothetical protein
MLLLLLLTDLLRQRQLFHTTYKMYMVSLGLWTFSLLLYSIAYGKYANTGYKETGMEYAGTVYTNTGYKETGMEYAGTVSHTESTPTQATRSLEWNTQVL